MTNGLPKGGQFLLEPAGTHTVFSPDDFAEDELSIGQTAEDFMDKEVIPHIERIEEKDYDVLLKAFHKGAELGLYMTAIPERWGGLGLPKRVTSLITEKFGKYGSFSVTYGAHATIGTLPIVYFGNNEQKERYLPRLATGELVGAYALSEPGSGSDALGARTTAVLNDAGTHYIVNGTKQWITNGAFADVYTVFMQIVDENGHHFSALIVDKDTRGFSSGPEEHKLGIRGSSTTQLIFEDAKVPVENLLGEKGRGHEIAFNILNAGRMSLSIGVLGGAKQVLKQAISYACERKQFRTPIIEFGALRQKVANAVCEMYAIESAGYRGIGLADDLTDSLGDLDADELSGKERMAPIEEYAIEASVCKVYGSEVLNRVASECLQMYGGYGYVSDYPAELAFRDARINTIFEGTNEINRLLIPGMLLKRAMKGRLDVMGWMNGLSDGPADVGEGPLANERHAVECFKGTAGILLQAAATKYMQGLQDQQEILLLLADLIIDAYVTDSVIARTLQRHENAHGDTTLVDAITRTVVALAGERVRTNGNRLVCALGDGGDTQGLSDKLAPYAVNLKTNIVAERRIIADVTIPAGGYCV